MSKTSPEGRYCPPPWQHWYQPASSSNDSKPRSCGWSPYGSTLPPPPPPVCSPLDVDAVLEGEPLGSPAPPTPFAPLEEAPPEPPVSPRSSASESEQAVTRISEERARHT